MVPCQEKIQLVKKEIPKIIGGVEQLTLPGIEVKSTQSNHVREKLVKIGKTILEIAHLLECSMIWSLKADVNTSKCEAWTLLEQGMEPDP